MEPMGIAQIYESMEYGPAPESAAIAQEWLERQGRAFGHFVGGAWREAATRFPTFSPATGQEIAQIGQATDADVAAAVAAAHEALQPWQELGGYGRARVLYALARLVQKHSRILAVLESIDNGKPIRETRDIDIPLVARHFSYHAGWAQLLADDPGPAPGWRYAPVGVCGQIIPWNFPLLMLAWKIAPAIAAGNTVVLKPAEFTSLTALFFAEICQEAGVPAGVVNVVTGDGEVGKAIVEHPGVDKIAFTGSTEVGRIIREATAGTGKKLSLELGGKSPFIVFEDADLDSAVEGVVDAIWFNQGQVCCAGSRLLVQEGVAAAFTEKLRRRMEKLRVGDPLDKAVDIGAIVDRVQLERISNLVEQGVREGATKFQPQAACPPQGWFYPPTLLTDVAPASTVAQVEIFGPVLVSMTFRTPEEAVALANNTVYGLAASVWTESLARAHDVAARIKAGTVWINCTNLFDASAGFGGYRESGFGREGGREGMHEYLRVERDAASVPVVYPKSPSAAGPTVDRTHKHFIGGKQVRPDSGYSLAIELADGSTLEVPRGNRKDVRNAVESARGAAPKWAAMSVHARAQILYFLAENLAADADRLRNALALSGEGDEVQAAAEALFEAAGWCDKYEGAVHPAQFNGLLYASIEPLGALGIVVPDEQPLLGLSRLAGLALSQGNAVVVIPSERSPLAACELIRTIEASDVPAGVLNLVFGSRAETVATLADHDGLDAIWAWVGEAAQVERASTGNLKQTWCPIGIDPATYPAREILRRATQVKNVWAPAGD